MKFKYKYPLWVVILIIVAIFFAVFTLTLNIIRAINAEGFSSSDIITLVVIVVSCVLILIMLISLLLSSYYTVTDKAFVLMWGILKQEIDLKQIEKAVYLEDKNKLTIYFNGDNFMDVSLYDVNPLDLVDELRKKNKKIAFEMINSKSITPTNDDKNDNK